MKNFNKTNFFKDTTRKTYPPVAGEKVYQTRRTIPSFNGILRVKKGYNPNSSSIGSGILPFLTFAAGSGILAIILSNTLASAGKIIKKNKKESIKRTKTNNEKDGDSGNN